MQWAPGVNFGVDHVIVEVSIYVDVSFKANRKHLHGPIKHNSLTLVSKCHSSGLDVAPD